MKIYTKNRLLFLPFMDCFLLLMRKRSYIKNLKNIMELKEFCSIFSQYLSWTVNPGIKQFWNDNTHFRPQDQSKLDFENIFLS